MGRLLHRNVHWDFPRSRITLGCLLYIRKMYKRMRTGSMQDLDRHRCDHGLHIGAGIPSSRPMIHGSPGGLSQTLGFRKTQNALGFKLNPRFSLNPSTPLV